MALRSDERLISTLQFAGSIGVVVAVAVALGVYFIRQQQREYENDAQAVFARQVAQQQSLLIERVNSAKDYLDFMRSRTEAVLKAKIREEVDQVVLVAGAIYRHGQGRHSPVEIERMIIDAVRPLRFSDGRGYFFIHRLDGRCVLLPTDPQLEGANLTDFTDDGGTRPMPLILQAARKPPGEGFVRYRWKLLGDPPEWGEKIGYVRLFAPLGWAIGTGEYRQVVEMDLQRDALERLRANDYAQPGYLAVVDDNGRVLVSPSMPELEGKRVGDLPPAAAGVVNLLLQKGREGGGFVHYDWIRPGGQSPEPKMTYVSRMDAWGWTLASGTYLGDVEAIADAGRVALAERLHANIRMTLLVLALGLIGSILVRWGSSVLMRRVIQRYEGNLAQRNAELKEANRQLFLVNFMVDHSSDLIFLIDQHGHLVYANRFVLDRLGWRLGAVVEGPLAEIAAGIDAGADSRRFETVVATGDGHSLPLEVGVREVSYDGQSYQFAIARDITERQRWDADLRRSNAELEAFAYVASHDLRQPLRAVSSFLSLLERRLAGRLEGDARDFLNFARDGAQRMDHLILDLLDYSRVGRLVEPAGPVDLARLVEALAPMVALEMAATGGRLEITTPLPTVWGYADALARLLQNLIGNAIKYRSPDRPPVIRISCHRDGVFWTVDVIDNGIGIDPQNSQRIFGLFQRLHGAGKYEGTGIGLAICRKVVDCHGGRIWVTSRLGEGAAFHFTLPAVPDELPARPPGGSFPA